MYSFWPFRLGILFFENTGSLFSVDIITRLVEGRTPRDYRKRNSLTFPHSGIKHDHNYVKIALTVVKAAWLVIFESVRTVKSNYLMSIM